MKTELSGGRQSNRCAVVTTGERGMLLEEIAKGLRQKGLTVHFLTPPLITPSVPYGLIILRAKGIEVTRWAIDQESKGSVVIPKPRMILIIKDRWQCRQLLAGSGIKMPEAVLGKPGNHYFREVTKLMPVVLKRRLIHKAPVHLLTSTTQLRAELAKYPPETELVAERFITGEHFTACFIGNRTFYFAKKPLDHGITAHVPFNEIPAGLLKCVKRYREITGLYFGKIDVVVPKKSSIMVVDCGVSPNLWQVPESGALLLDFFTAILIGQCSSENPEQQIEMQNSDELMMRIES